MSNYSVISSKDNDYLKLVNKLQTSAKRRKEEGKIVLEGLRLCDDALNNNVAFDITFVTETFFSKYQNETTAFFNKSNLNFVLKDYLFEKISDTVNPQGIIVVADIPMIENKIDITKKYVALDNIQDVSNLGAIARTCEALGVGGIIISSNGCDPYSPKSLRASMGTVLRMPIYIADDISKFIIQNKLRGFACVVDKNATPIKEVEFNNGDVIIIGNEANGIGKETAENIKNKITIPMSGNAESLNASAAAAIAIYELTK